MDSSPPGEAVHHATRLPPSAQLPADDADGSERPPGVTEDDTTRGASRPSIAVQPQRLVNGTVRSEGLGEQGGSRENNGGAGAVASNPSSESPVGEPTVRAAAATPCSDAGHRPETESDRAADDGTEGVDRVVATASSSALSPGTLSARKTPSPPPSRRTSDDSLRNPSPEPRASRSPREDHEADTLRRKSASPPSSATTTSTPGAAEGASALASASPPPGRAVQEAPPVPRSSSEDNNANRAPRTTHEAGRGSAKDESGEDMKSALWRIQAKSSFSSVLNMYELRSIAPARSSRSGTGSMSDDQDAVRPSRHVAGADDPRRSNHGSRNNSSGGLRPGGSAEQQATPLRGRYKSFQLRQDSSLRAVPEQPRTDPLVARLVAAAAAEEIFGGALSSVVSTSQAGVAGGGSGGGGASDGRLQ
eukprot:g7548.t1